jgi:hypothetical protein
MTIMLGAGLQSSRIRDPTGLHKLTIELKHLILVPPVRRLRGGYEDFFPPYLPGSHFPIPAECPSFHRLPSTRTGGAREVFPLKAIIFMEYVVTHIRHWHAHSTHIRGMTRRSAHDA